MGAEVELVHERAGGLHDATFYLYASANVQEAYAIPQTRDLQLPRGVGWVAVA